MLETSEDRIKLLKTGFTQKQIEVKYIEGNEFKIVSLPILVEIVEVEAGQTRNTCENAVGSAHSLGLGVANLFNVSRFECFSSITN